MTRTGLDDAAYARIRALENNYGSPVGMRVFDMRHIIKVPQRRETETLGYSYILPQAGVPREDRRRAHFRWKINQATGLLGPTAVALGAWRATDVPSIQGALMKGGRIGLSSSFSSAPGLWASGRGANPLFRRSWPTGAEDVTYAVSGRVYSLTEFAGSRRVFAVMAGDLGL